MSLTANAGTSEEPIGKTGMPGWSALASVTFAYAAVLLYVVSPFLFHSQSLYLSDYTYNFAPAAKFIQQVFTAEHGFTLMKPLWNPYVLGGTPEVAVSWPLSYLPGYAAYFFDAARAQGFLLFFHLLVAGVGGFVWFSNYSRESAYPRREGPALLVERLTGPAALFGFMFMLCGYMLGSSINLLLLFSVCWTPLALFLIDRIAAAPKLAVSLTALLSVVLAQQFGAGRPEMFIAECFIYSVYSLLKIAELAPESSRANAATRFILQLAAALLLSLACNAANIFPMIEAVKSSPQLSKFDPSDALNWSAGWFDFLGLLFMQPLGELNMAHYALYPTYPNSMAYVTSLFLGAPVMVLAFIGTGDTRWNQKAFWLWMMMIFVLVSLGEFVPLWKPVYESIPSINLLRFPVKMTVFVELALAALAARGWYLVNRGEATGKDIFGATVFWGLFMALGLLVLGSTLFGNTQALGVVMSMSSALDDLNVARQAALKLTANIAVCGFMGFATCLALANLKGQWQLPLRFFVVLAIVSSLVINGRMHLWNTVDKTFFDDTASVLSLVEKEKAQAEVASSAEAYWNPLSAPRDYKVLSLFRHPIAVPQKVLQSPEGQMDKEFMRYARYILAPNTNMDRGINMLSGMPVLPDWQTVFMETGLLPRSNIRADLNHEAGKSDIPLYKWCQATATKYILCPIDTQSEEDLLIRDSKFLDRHYFKVRAEDKSLNTRIYEVSPIRKRVQLFSSAKKMDSRKDVLKHINRSDKLEFDPLSICILCEPEPPSVVSFQQKNPDINESLLKKVLAGNIVNRPGTAEITADDRESVLIEVNATVPSVLVFADSYYSGWKATDNGVPTHVFIADGLMKAVLLEPGQHRVAFKYVPRSYLVGLMVSFYTFFVLLALVVVPHLWNSLNQMRRRAIIQS